MIIDKIQKLMKMNKIKITLFSLLSLCSLLFMQSCESGDALHLKWLEKGETVYAAKVDSVAVHGGNNRANIEVNVAVKNLESVKVYWNDYADSVEIMINKQKGLFNKTITGLDEQSYLFNIVSKDIYGNLSLPFEAIGEVYGDYYTSILTNRRYNSFKTIDGIPTLVFEPAVADAIFTEVVYSNSSDEEVSVQLPVSDDQLFISDFKSDLRYRTAFLPNELAMDTFYTEFKELSARLQIDGSNWEVVSFSSQHGGDANKAANFIDGDVTTRWHTLYGGPSYPHVVTIDLAVLTSISEFELYRRVTDEFANQGQDGDPRGCDKFKLEVSVDNDNWIDLGTFDFDRMTNDAQSYPVTLDQKVRYVRFTGLEGPEDFMVMGEMMLYQ